MQASTLPVEVLDRVAQFSRRQELLVLSRVCRQLQPLAESRLYEELSLREPVIAARVCAALASRNFVRAPYVRRFWLWQDSRFCQRGPWHAPFLHLVQDVLIKMDNLENLYFYDDVCSNTWIFDVPLPFKLRDAWLHLHWDDRLVAFLETQDRLRYLSIQTSVDDEEGMPHRAPRPGSLPALETLEAPMHVAFDLLPFELKQLGFIIDDENAPLFSSFVEALATINKTIRSLHVVAVPEFLVADTLRMLGASSLSTTLRHLGVLSLPLMDRNAIHRSLLNFSRLECLQLDVSHWTNAPLVPYMQRMVATELRTYCPSLCQFVFWHGTNQTLWRFEREQWTFQQFPGPRHVTRDGLWRDYF